MVLRSVLVPTPKLAPLTRRVNDEGLRARIVHAPETANDKARVLAEGGHAPETTRRYKKAQGRRAPRGGAAGADHTRMTGTSPEGQESAGGAYGPPESPWRGL